MTFKERRYKDISHRETLLSIVQRLRYGTRRSLEGEKDDAKFPEDIRLRLLDYETDQSFLAALTHRSLSKAILFLEGFLTTCLSIPALRPHFLPLADSKIVHVLSKMLDHLLGLESLEKTIPELAPLDTSPEADISAVKTADICVQFLLKFILDCGMYVKGKLDPIGTIKEVCACTSEFVEYFRLMVAAPTAKEMDKTFHMYSATLHQGVDIATLLSAWLYSTRHEEDTAPHWGNLQDDQELEKFLQASPSVCNCSTTAALVTCQKYLKQLQSVLDSFLDRVAIHAHLLRDATNIFEDMLKALQANTTSESCVQKECLVYQRATERIKYTTEHRLTVFLLSHLLRIARLTSNFTKNNRSLDARLYFMDVLCKSI